MAIKKPIKRKASAKVVRPAVSNYFAPPPSATELPETATKAEYDEQTTQFEKSIGVTVGSLKEVFDREYISLDEKSKKLVDMLATRVKNGRTFSLQNYRIYAAIDEAWKIPFKQITPTLIQKILSKKYPDGIAGIKEVERDLASWGLSQEELYTDPVKGEDGTEGRFLKERTFWRVFVPLVKAYTTIRIAKLYSDRENNPWLKYEPEELTDEGMVIGQILTKLVQKMVHQYGYKAVFKQVLNNTLKYGVCLAFPAEAWHSEQTADTDGDGQHSIKQGLRYNIPHPTRLFYDLGHRLSTLHTDTGVEWAGYWRVCKYGDVFAHPLYWRKKQITACSSNWFNFDLSGNYFQDVFPCTMKLLTSSDRDRGQREDASALYYSDSDRDKAVFVTDMFCKLTPSEWGLSDYKYPVWFRFVMANDDTVCYAEPLPYCPALYAGYDPDENLAANSSMSLEILPWQDMVSNVLSQWLCSVRQNLKNIVLYDVDQMPDPDIIKKVQATSSDVETITWLPLSSKKMRWASQGDQSKMFTPISLPRHDVSQFVITMDKIIQLMERVLNMSASETGSAGVHIQTAEEIRVISQNTSIRVNFTGSFIDEFIDAWKHQLVSASRAYMDDEFVTEVSLIKPEHKKILEELGFSLLSETGRVVKVKGKRSKVVLDTYISSREGQDRVNNPQVAQVMLQAVQAAGKMGLLEALGPEQIVEIFNRASILAGAPKDFKLIIPQTRPQAQQPIQGAGQGGGGAAPSSPPPNPMEAIMQALQKQVGQQIGEAGQAIMGQVEKAIGSVVEAIKVVKEESAAARAEAGQNTQVNVQQQDALKQLTELVLKLDGIVKAAAQPPMPDEMMQPPQVPIAP